MTLVQLQRIKPGHLLGAYVDRQWLTVKVSAVSHGKLSFFVHDDPLEFEHTCDTDSVYFRDKVTL